MANTFAAVEVRRMRGNLVLVGIARTPRGQRYIKAQVPIDASSMTDPDFKTKMIEAAKKLVGETP